MTFMYHLESNPDQTEFVTKLVRLVNVMKSVKLWNILTEPFLQSFLNTVTKVLIKPQFSTAVSSSMILFVTLVVSVLMLCFAFTCYRLINTLFPKEHRRDIFVAGEYTQIKITDFWHVTPWSLAEVNRRSGGMHCLRIHGQRVSQAASTVNCAWKIRLKKYIWLVWGPPTLIRAPANHSLGDVQC
jgi:hypothetical protein